MILIDADVLASEIQETKDLLQKGLGKDAKFAYMSADSVLKTISNQSTVYDPDKVVNQLEERTAFLKDCKKYDNETVKEQDKSYSTMMMYEVKDLVDDLIEIVKGGGVK